MNFNDLKRRMPALLDSGVSIELTSAPGRGKSSFIEETVEMMSKRDSDPKHPEMPGAWGFCTMFLATQTPPDLLGYMFKGSLNYTDYNGHDHTIAVTDPTMPPWMVTREGKPVWNYKRGILLLDEYGQGQADVKAAAAELLLNKRLGKWQLPPGWSVIACSNRLTDRSGVTKPLDFVINRRLEIEITDDIQSWEDWAFSHGIEPLFISFAHQNPHVVFSAGVPEKPGPWCTPRSLVLLSRVLKEMADDDGKIPTDKFAIEAAAGLVGGPAASALFAHVKLGHEMPSIEDIIKSPMKAHVPDKPDAQILITYNLAARIDDKTATPIVQYMERLPKEFAVTFAKAACRRDSNLVYSPSFEQWATKNSSLMVALVDHKK